MSEFAKGLCIECGSEQPVKYMEESQFQNPSCKYCGGVVHYIDADADSQAYKAREDAKRGIGTTYDKVDPSIRNTQD